MGWTVYAPDRAKVAKVKRREGSVRAVTWLSRPAMATQVLQLDNQNMEISQSADHQMAGGALGDGAAPVQVTLPVEGQALYFEKLLALDASLWVGFDYAKLK